MTQTPTQPQRNMKTKAKPRVTKRITHPPDGIPQECRLILSDFPIGMISVGLEEPADTNPRKRKHIKRRVPRPSQAVAVDLKRQYSENAATASAHLSKRARLSVIKNNFDKLRAVTLVSPTTTVVLPTVEEIKVGSDCTGLGTELLALSLAKVDHVPMFGSEINEATRRIYRGLHGRDHNLHSDIFKRPKQSACDLYVAGPPCQAWSQMGNGAGLDDLAGRGLVFYSCLEYIRDRRPRAVVLENVVGLRNLHPAEFSDVLNILEKIGYQVTWQILDNCDSGLPQRRPRLYIVGIRSDSISYKFTFPQKMQVRPKIDKFLDTSPAPRFITKAETQRRNLEVARKTISSKGLQGTVLVDLAASARFENLGVGISPCIIATRARQGGFLIVNQKRMTTTHEIGRLQGFPTWAVDKMLTTSQPGDVRFALGNAMGVNVLARLLPRVAYSAGLLKSKPKDIWKHFSSKDAAGSKLLPDDMYKEHGIIS